MKGSQVPQGGMYGSVCITVPLSLFSMEEVSIATKSLPMGVEAHVEVDHAKNHADILLQGMQGEHIKVAADIFRRQLISASAHLAVRSANAHVQSLLGASADSVSSESVRWLNESDEDDPILGHKAVRQGSTNNLWGSGPEGYRTTIRTDEQEALIALDPRRFLLPVVLSAGKELRDRLSLVTSNLGPKGILVTLKPRPGVNLMHAVEMFLKYVGDWSLPPIPRKSVGTIDLEVPIEVPWRTMADSEDHPARVRPGAPITHFRTTYGMWEGVSLPYRLNEIFPLELAEGTFLISTRHRAWAILSKQDYRKLLEMRIHEDEHAFLILETLGIILTKRNVESIARMHSARYAWLHRPPTLFIIVVTNRCNLGCIYCHAEAGKAIDMTLDMSVETAYRAVDFFFSVPQLEGKKDFYLEFQGGECLLRWDLITATMDYALAKARERGMNARFTVCTNLTTLTDEIAQEIARRGVQVSSSLDGPKCVHDRQRPFQSGQGSYQRVLSWSNRLREAYGVTHGYLPTLTRHNLGYEADLIDEYRRHGCTEIYLRYVNRVGRANNDDSAEIGLSPAEYVGLWDKGLHRVLEYNLRGEALRERKTMNLLGNMLSPGWSYMCLRRPCGVGIHQVVVDQNGGIFGCDQARSNSSLALGNVYESSYDDCYCSQTARILRTLTSELFPKCHGCAMGPFCGYCVSRGLRQHDSPYPIMADDYECEIYSQMIPHLASLLSQPAAASVLTNWVES